jgi:dTDP-4-amino-4,6-dideoxygalactose transaminase
MPRPFNRPIYVTRPLSPNPEKFGTKMSSIFEAAVYTNGGSNVVKLQEDLRRHLQVQNLSLFCNGTIALLTTLKALNVTGKVITTPFTFPATLHALSWIGVEPVFCDIDSNSLCIDPDRVEESLSSDCSAILGVHVYGHPCNVVKIDKIGRDNDIKVIYDGAHAFGSTIDQNSIGNFGDATMFSFHATKLFHTGEGGAIATRDAQLFKKLELLKNFGIESENIVAECGINGKMNEVQASLGLTILDEVEMEVKRRAEVKRTYREALSGLPGFKEFLIPTNVNDSYQYCIYRVNEELSGIHPDALIANLRNYNVFARRYFYPLCNTYPHYRSLHSARASNLPNAYAAANEVLALPFYGSLSLSEVHHICDIVKYCTAN